MSDETNARSIVVLASSGSSVARPDVAATERINVEVAPNTNNEVNEASPAADFKDINGSELKTTIDEPSPAIEEKITTSAKVVEMDSKTDAAEEKSAVADESSADPATATPSKSKARRKSAGVPEHKAKKLNKKASKMKMSHADAKPGEYYFIRLKGYPLWPGIVCDESMLPESLKKSRPVTAAKADGTYRTDYEDGGKKVHDRTFPVMYLYTNEFSWTPNYDLVDLDLDEVGNVDQKMRKDLLQAHKLAAEKHDLEYFKQVLIDFEAAREAEAEAKVAAKAAKEASKSSAKGKKKSKSAVDVADEDNEDVEMPDAEGDLDVEGGATEKKPKSSKKRKAVEDPEEANTPQAPSSSSAKKIKLKFTATPKPTNGTTPKSTTKKDSAAKPPKSKSKKSTTNGTAEKAAPPTPKEPELSPEEKRLKKEKEILFLRHKLQKGLLTRDQQPKEEEMKQMSEFISKLEGYADLEVSIIRATKINKVLKAILKLSEIPKESEFQFKDRSKTLLEKWNKILESAEQPAASVTPGTGDETSSKELTNGILNGSKSEGKQNGEKNEGNNEEPIPEIDTDKPITEVTSKEEDMDKAKAANDSFKPSVAEPTAVEAAS